MPPAALRESLALTNASLTSAGAPINGSVPETRMSLPKFKDAAASAAMDRDGFFLVAGLAANGAPRLDPVYRDMLGAMSGSDPYFPLRMTGTNWIGDLDLRARVLAELSRIMAPPLAAVVDDTRLVGAGFRVKYSGD